MLSSVTKIVSSGLGVVGLGVLLLVLSAPGLFLQPVKMDRLEGEIIGYSPIVNGTTLDGTTPDGVGYNCSLPSRHCDQLHDAAIEFRCDSALISGSAKWGKCPPAPTGNEYIFNMADFHPPVPVMGLSATGYISAGDLWILHGGNTVFAIRAVTYYPIQGGSVQSETFYSTDVYDEEYGICKDCSFIAGYDYYYYAYHSKAYSPYLAASGVVILAIGLVWPRLPGSRARNARRVSRSRSSSLDGRPPS